MSTIETSPRKKPGRKPGRTHTAQLKVMLRPEDMAAFADEAERRGLTYSELVRRAIKRWLEGDDG